MTNIVRLQEQLKDLPQSALINYVQNPNGMVPSYLALSELERRKAMQASVAQAPEQSVAESMVGEAQQMQQGIAGLPVGQDMYQGVANGIASGAEEPQAFEKGGNVKAKKYLSPTDFSMLMAGPDFTLRPYDESLRYKHPKLSDETMKFVLPQMPTVGEYPQLKKAKPDWYETGVPTADVADWYVKHPEEKPIMGEEKIASKPVAGGIGGLPTPVNIDPAYLNSMAGDVPTEVAVAGRGRAGAGAGRKDTRSVASQGIVAGKNPFEWKDIAYDKEGYEAMMPEEVTAEGERERYKAALGKNEAAKALQARLATMDANLSKQQDRAPWLALMDAGLGIAAGKSPFALQNIAEGAAKGVDTYTAERDKINQLEERRFVLANQLAQAERAEQVAAVNFGENSSQAKRAERRTVQLAALNNKNELALQNAKGKFEADVKGAEIGLKERDLAQALEIAKMQVGAQLTAASKAENEIENLVKAYQKKDPSLDRADALDKAYQTKFGAQYAAVNQRFTQNREKSLLDELETVRFGKKNEPRRKEILAELDMIRSGGAAPASGSVPSDIAGIMNKYK